MALNREHGDTRMTSLKCVRIPTSGDIAGLEPTDYIAPEMLR